jgi:hypothetical protein
MRGDSDADARQYTCQKYFYSRYRVLLISRWKLDLRNYLGIVKKCYHNSTCNPTSPLSSLDDMIHVILEKSPPFNVYLRMLAWCHSFQFWLYTLV